MPSMGKKTKNLKTTSFGRDLMIQYIRYKNTFGKCFTIIAAGRLLVSIPNLGEYCSAADSNSLSEGRMK